MNKKTLIKIVTFLGGIYFFLEFFLPEEIAGYHFSAYNDQISTGLRLIGAMAIGLGIINIIIVHLPKVLLVKKNFFNSLALLLGLALILIATFYDWYLTEKSLLPAKQLAVWSEYVEKIAAINNPDQQQEKIKLLQLAWEKQESVNLKVDQSDPEKQLQISVLLEKYQSSRELVNQKITSANLDNLAQDLNLHSALLRQLINAKHEQSFSNQFYEYLFKGLFVALGSAMFSLLGFYVASAAYRAFQIRTLESALMMTAALIVMLGQIPFGVWVYSGFVDWRLWLLQVPNSAAFRGIVLGAGVAGLIMAFRMWLSLESDFNRKNK